MVWLGGVGVLQLELQGQTEQRPDVEVIKHYLSTATALSPPRNPLCAVFPTEVSCNIPNVGAAGNEQAHNGLCVLTQVLCYVRDDCYLITIIIF